MSRPEHSGDTPHTHPSVLERLAPRAGSSLRLRLPDAAEDDAGVVETLDPTRGGDELGSRRYQVFGEIARGGVGAVYKGRDVDLGRDVAVKVLHERHRKRPDILKRFVEEAQIGGQLQHPGIVPVYELGLQADERPFFAMKLVKGETLAALLERRAGPADDRRRLLAIFEQVCQTVAYAHARSVVHRDLKPSNVMVGAFGEVQVVDWGFAKVLKKGGIDDEQRLRRAQSELSVIETVRSTDPGSASLAGSVIGTPAYMPPEQARGDVELMDQRSDVFALGAILCEIVTGAPPYSGAPAEELIDLAARCDMEPVYARLAACGADHALVELARDCLTPNRPARPRDAGVLAAAIHDHLTALEQRARRSELAAARAEVRAEHERRRRRLVVMLAGSMVMALGALAGGWSWLDRLERDRLARAGQQVQAALQDAVRLEGEARTLAPRDALAIWERALAAADRARSAAGEDAGLAGEAAAAYSRLQQQHAAAGALAERHARQDDLLRRLTAARVPRQEAGYRDLRKHDAQHADAAFHAAFLAMGLDVEALDAEAVFAQLDGPRNPELTAEIDYWLRQRWQVVEETVAGDGRISRLVALADRFDAADVPLRREMRASIGKPTPDLARLRALAADASVDTLDPGTAILLAALLEDHEAELALGVLRRSRLRHPDDLNLLLALGRACERARPPRWLEARGCYLAATGLAPDSPLPVISAAWACFFLRAVDEMRLWAERAVELAPQDAAAQDVLGGALLNLGDHQGALAQYLRATELDPDDAQAFNNGGVALLSAGRLDEAERWQRRALALRSDWARPHVSIGVVLHAKRDFDGAREQLELAVDLDPEFAEAHAWLARVLADLDEGELSEVHCRRGLELEPWNLEVLVTCGRTWRVLGRMQEAEECLRRALELAPAWPLPALGLAHVFLRSDRLDEALACVQRVTERHPHDAEAYYTLGLVLAGQGDTGGAELAYERAVLEDPRHAAAHVNLGLLRKLRDRAEAMEHYRLAAEADPWLPQAHVNLGGLLRDSAPEEALLHTQKACELDPRNANCHFQHGVVLRKLGRLDDAERAFERAVHEDPEHALAHVNLGNRLVTRDRAKAIEHYRLAIAADPRLWDGHCNLGKALRADGKPDEALAHLEHACELDPRSADGHNARGRALADLGHLDDAVAAFERALLEDPGFASARINLGNLLFSRDLAGAIEQFELAMASAPQSWVARYSLGQALYADGQFEDAVPHLEEALALGSPDEYLPHIHNRLGLGYYRLGEYARALASFRTEIDLDPESGLVARFNAACTAVLTAASCTPAEQARLRDEALGWLRTCLAHWQGQVARAVELPAAVATLQGWTEDADLASVRDPDALERLPEAERGGWERLWADVTETLTQARRGGSERR